jgi:hypothetical protein
MDRSAKSVARYADRRPIATDFARRALAGASTLTRTGTRRRPHCSSNAPNRPGIGAAQWRQRRSVSA